jgi:hypothetical protein
VRLIVKTPFDKSAKVAIASTAPLQDYLDSMNWRVESQRKFLHDSHIPRHFQEFLNGFFVLIGLEVAGALRSQNKRPT